MKRLFTFEDSWKVWVDYMSTIVSLNYTSIEYPLNQKGINYSEGIVYPIAGVFKKKITTKHKIKSFNDFCYNPETQDERMSACLVGWYWRFKNRINL